MKILNTDDLMQIASDELPDGAFEATNAVIDAVDALAKKIAEHYGIETGDTSWEGKAFAGLCASFSPKHKGQPCPEPIDDGDPGGDWGNASDE